MNSYFLKLGNTFKIAAKESLDIYDQLPGKTFVIKLDQYDNMYLETIDSFALPGKLYGNTTRHTDRIFTTFLDRPAATGVMLSGEKGSGKTLLTKSLAIKAASQGIPTIVINSPFTGEKFNSFLQSITQPCVIVFDEFEKVYDSDAQESILTLLDGVFPSKKLFLLTCNDKWRIDSHMRNRPGRLYYMLEFAGIEQAFIEEYCNDHLTNKTHIPALCRIASVFSAFNFDMLKAIVEEMNRFNESPQEVLELLNAKPEFSERVKYQVSLQTNDKEIDSELLDDKEITCNPIGEPIQVSYKEFSVDDADDYDWMHSSFNASQLKHVDSSTGVFVFVNDNGDRLQLKKKVKHHPSYAF